MEEPVFFGIGKPAPDLGPEPKMRFGGKGYGLIQMSQEGYPVPPGMVLSVDYLKAYYNAIEHGVKDYPKTVAASVEMYLKLNIEPIVGAPMLLSVRSGAPVSMPGMMDTILNVGINTANVSRVETMIGLNAAYESYCRLIKQYAITVKGVSPIFFANLPKYDWMKHLKVYRDLVKDAFPQSLQAQLAGAIEAVWKSWNSERAVEYRKLNKIPNDWGTAVTIQAMVFGNQNDQSCTGVLFTRNPKDGNDAVTGEFLINAQGEDVVAGVVTPKNLDKMVDWNAGLYHDLIDLVKSLEVKYRDVQDVEFTVQNGKLYLLQTRTAKRSALAAFKIAVDMVKDGKINKAEALKRVTKDQYLALAIPKIDPEYKVPPAGVGLPASAGLATGVAVFSSADAKASPVPCILLTKETNPEDFPGMAASAAIVTSHGGETSHAAVVARSMNKPCVVGLAALEIHGVTAKIGGKSFFAGEKITVDGATGRVWVGETVPVVGGSVPEVAKELIAWGAEEKQIFGKVEPKAENLIYASPVVSECYVEVSRLPDSVVINNLIKTLNTDKAARGVLCFDAAKAPQCHEDDVGFLAALGLSDGAEAPKATQEDFLSALMKKWPKGLRARWKVRLPEGVSAKVMDALVKEHGWTLDLSGSLNLMPAEQIPLAVLEG